MTTSRRELLKLMTAAGAALTASGLLISRTSLSDTVRTA